MQCVRELPDLAAPDGRRRSIGRHGRPQDDITARIEIEQRKRRGRRQEVGRKHGWQQRGHDLGSLYLIRYSEYDRERSRWKGGNLAGTDRTTDAGGTESQE